MFEKIKNPRFISFLSIAIFLSAICATFLYTKKQKNEIISEIYSEDDTQIAETKKEEEVEKIIVHIDGEVNNPGVYELEKEARIDDAIDMAGGLTSLADLDEINLAYKISDGVKVSIPKKEVQKQTNKSTKTTTKKVVTTQTIGVTKSEDTSSANSNESNGKVNLNIATLSELDTLNGIGLATAQKIIDYRRQKGGFSSIEELKSVNGIGEAKYNKIKDSIEI